jgi:ArsR family transcriptional regulator
MESHGFYPLLADRTRRRVLALLVARGELCVCDLTAALEAPQPTVSRHLAELRAAEVIATRREGRWVHYRLADGLPGWVQETLAQLARALSADGELAEDLARLEAAQGDASHCTL